MQAIKEFVAAITWLHEPDYGDFKRAAGLKLSLLSSQLSKTDTNKQILDQMKMHLVYHPSGEVEPTRHFLIQKAASLK